MAAMHQAGEALATVAPALAFLLVGVPLAALLDELGFFDAVAGLLEHRFRAVPVLALWVLAAATTVVLNLDTTIVLLTPLYVRLARRSGVDPVPLALVPLLLAAFASSVQRIGATTASTRTATVRTVAVSPSGVRRTFSQRRMRQSSRIMDRGSSSASDTSTTVFTSSTPAPYTRTIACTTW